MSDAVFSFEGPILTLQQTKILMPSDTTYPWWGPSPTAFSGPQEAKGPSKPRRETLSLEDGDKNALLVALDGDGESTNPSFALLPNVGDRHPVARTFEIVPAEKASPIDSDEALKLMMRRAKATKRRNRHRQRVKEEWQSLRLKETRLSAELEGLLVKRSQGNAIRRQVWKEMMSKELAARSQAEKQQRQIRMEIERRAAVIHTLQDILYTQQFLNTSAPQDWGVDDIKLSPPFRPTSSVMKFLRPASSSSQESGDTEVWSDCSSDNTGTSTDHYNRNIDEEETKLEKEETKEDEHVESRLNEEHIPSSGPVVFRGFSTQNITRRQRPQTTAAALISGPSARPSSTYEQMGL
ncbi:hypothetical protein ON010_g469 [Phytophthora cinnamomi]|nr:hypothetical protein ON010_g469 [Phytophthora cinnamomi]